MLKVTAPVDKLHGTLHYVHVVDKVDALCNKPKMVKLS